MPEDISQEQIRRDFQILSMDRLYGTLVAGKVFGHWFLAKIYPHHASSPSEEIEQSRICKLQLRRSQDGRLVFNFDRKIIDPGKDPLSQEHVTRAIVKFLVSGALASFGLYEGLERSEQESRALKEHWEKVFQEFDKIEKLHGQRTIARTDEVERLREDLSRQVEKISDGNRSRGRPSQGRSLEISYDP